MKKIRQRKISMNNPESDAELKIDEKKEYYVLTRGFFKFFFNAYGCNQII